MKLILPLIAALAFAGTASADDAAPRLAPAPGVTPDVAQAIKRKDAELFDAVFARCDADKVATLVTDDFEFYHDEHGEIARTAKEFTDAIRGACERQKNGTDYRARRELVESSLTLYPIAHYGVIETGEHRFYKLTPGKPDTLTGIARFTHVWKEDHGEWRVARVLSYAHQKVE